MMPFQTEAIEWVLDRNVYRCLEDPSAMEAQLIQDGWPEPLVLYARAIMREMARKATNNEVWRPKLGQREPESTLTGLEQEQSAPAVQGNAR